MADGSLKDIWTDIDLKDQPAVNQALKDSMFTINPAVEKVWNLNLKVNILYAVISFSAAVTIIVLAILQSIKDVPGE